MKEGGIRELNGQGPLGIHVRRGGRNIGGNGLEAARKIEQSISYMLQHLNQPLHVATLAAAVNVSPSHYCALFKRWTGCPPIDYFIHLRMQHACRLFDSTSLNVKEVAAALGYDDPFYFSRIFKAVNRVAPSEYRAMPKKQKDAIKGAGPAFAVPALPGSQKVQTEDHWRLRSHGLVNQTENYSAAIASFGTQGVNKLR